MHPDRNCSMNFVRTHACCVQTREITARFLCAFSRNRAKLRQFAREKRRELQSRFQRWHGKIYLYLREETQPVLAKLYRIESRAFSSISRQTARTRTVGIPREIVRLAAFLREDTRSRGFARDSRSRILSRANAINNFGRDVCIYVGHYGLGIVHSRIELCSL